MKSKVLTMAEYVDKLRRDRDALAKELKSLLALCEGGTGNALQRMDSARAILAQVPEPDPEPEPTNQTLLSACQLAAVRLEGGNAEERAFNAGIAQKLRAAIAKAVNGPTEGELRE